VPSQVAARWLRSSDKVFGYCHPNVARALWTAVIEEAGLPSLTPHEAGRRTFATRAFHELEMDLLEVARAGRWKSLAMAARYINENNEQKTASNKLGEDFGKMLAKQKLKIVK
jgi:integrase